MLEGSFLLMWLVKNKIEMRINTAVVFCSFYQSKGCVVSFESCWQDHAESIQIEDSILPHNRETGSIIA